MALVRQFMTTEASTKKDPDLFLQLHEPNTRIRVVESKPMVFEEHGVSREGSELFVNEEVLLQAVASSTPEDPNRVFVVVGEPGSGKSHLARWIEYTLAQRRKTDSSLPHVPIHIPRHVDSLASVVNRLAQHTGLTVAGIGTWDPVSAPPDKLSAYLAAAVQMELGNGTASAARNPDLALLVESSAFRQLLTVQVVHYQEQRKHNPVSGTRRELLELTRDAISALAKSIGAQPSESTLADWHVAVAGSTRDALIRQMGLDKLDLKTLLATISKRYKDQGLRAVLILEDVTSFDLLHKDVLLFLLDESAGHFDALICWTTGYEQEYMHTYQRQRYTARLSLTDENNETYSLQDGKCVNLVRRYMDAVRIRSAVPCEECARLEGVFAGCYPFTPVFIRKIYDNLISTNSEEWRTPRHLLDRAIKSYLELASRDGPFPPLTQPESVRDIVYDRELYALRDRFSAFVSLMGWYGVKLGGDQPSISIDTRVAVSLGVAVPAQFRGGRSIEVAITGDNTSQTELSDAARSVSQQNALKVLRLELQSWLSTMGAPAHYVEFARAIAKGHQLFRLSLPYAFSHPNGAAPGTRALTYGLDRADANIVLESQSFRPPRGSVMLIAPGRVGISAEHEYAVLDNLLAFHTLGHFPPDANISLVRVWLERHHARIASESVSRAHQGLLMPVPNFLILARILLRTWCGDTRRLASPLDALAPMGECPRTKSPVLEYAPVELRPLAKMLPHIDDALNSIFCISKDFQDAGLLNTIWDSFNLDRELSTAATITLSHVDDEFRLGGRLRLRDVAREVRTVASQLVAMTSIGPRHEGNVRLERIATATSSPFPETVEAMGTLYRVIQQHGTSLATDAGVMADPALWRRWFALTDNFDGDLEAEWCALHDFARSAPTSSATGMQVLAWAADTQHWLDRQITDVVETAIAIVGEAVKPLIQMSANDTGSARLEEGRQQLERLKSKWLSRR
ncbi:MAG: hypothetical protein EBQ56_10100 [Proteobacteria bacterium]|nr:hypothetical protein [Actinomycetota bacterium]NBY48100.1 hypothetical protein [Pseudomonadota bacterium]